ncbi:penicillin-insensitive murein endopeptidase [Vibrio sp. CAU 1672]|uniref:penicillin-insensitive murein endopeptidase n=1 Tax=Vibrio sp. CAU 1672 TaxID=3032594 RepID=UPI0023DCDC5C|nr:penicillin-insensitive murein endopeptidase [Vibrio sp. CAU 1672]MDF2155608.1 penicillin-insensitive murein endopeptidase [Vibrio sp. CAU 1672]
MKLSVLSVFLFCSASLLASPWEEVKAPTLHQPSSIGGYANGCLEGAVPLPLNGVGYQVLRSQANRYYGHPRAIQFVERLSLTLTQRLDTILLIGDLSLPRGGRFASGHSSHQTGLDIDVWLRFADTPLSERELQLPEPLSMVDFQRYSISPLNWDERHFEMVKYAAQDHAVARIFVHPVIKQQLCHQESTSGDGRRWLQKVRPWWGHHYHFHVRLTCPANSSSCIEQAPPPEGDGCGAELSSWITHIKQNQSTAKKRTRSPGKHKVMPDQCQLLLTGNAR